MSRKTKKNRTATVVEAKSASPQVHDLKEIFEPLSRWLYIAEWSFCVAAFAVLLFLHLTLWSHAGSFWRDECNSVLEIKAPTISQMFAWLKKDSAPPLFYCAARLWFDVGLARPKPVCVAWAC